LHTAPVSIELRGVTHTYHRERENSNFILGPVDLIVQPGELLFIIGGNGSGKTTLVKLLTGLYIPEEGEIRLNGQAVNDATREYYRRHFSVVFSDFYLFESLLGLDTRQIDKRARTYLSRLQLDHKVEVKNGVLSTTQLSQGQRKRLALLTAYLEDRPVYIFDEWAADQDPLFKEVFYLQLLPELKAQGKTVIVISHDDKYYQLADRIVKLDYGKVEYDRLLAEPILGRELTEAQSLTTAGRELR
jgi:putative ATP-binding cassette transporter